MLYDLHCHLDFDPDPARAADRAADSGIVAFSSTVEPSGYAHAAEVLSGRDGVFLGVGLHPWWVRQGDELAAQLDGLEEAIARTRLVGEVGLDAGPAHVHTMEAQLVALDRVLACCAREGGRLLSLHAVRATGPVLVAIERHGACEQGACVFHWFSGTPEELRRAVALGCFFSVNPRMLATRRGRALVRAMPENRLLLETDWPEQGRPYDAPAAAEALEAALSEIAELQALPRDEVAQGVEERSRALLGI